MRTKVTLFFAVIAMAATIGLSALTYSFARSSLIDQRHTDARQQAIQNALSVLSEVRSDPEGLASRVAELRTERDGFAVVQLGPQDRFPTDVRYDESVFPTSLRGLVVQGQSGMQSFRVDGRPYIAVGIPLPGVNASYYESFPLADAQRTLRVLGFALAGGTAAIVLAATGVGWWTSRRLLRPVGRLADAAGGIAAGDLQTRVPRDRDPDLDRLVVAFNGMADAVQARIEREERFASDVSHELRSPITALTAAVEVLDRRRSEMPERTGQAMGVVVDQIRRFDSMVLDLLELSRIDAGTVDVHPEPLDIGELTTRIAARLGYRDVPVEVDRDAPRFARIDKLRLERVLANLLDNAVNHAGGPTRVTIGNGAPGFVELAVEDAGPGVARGERVRIFERFARGSASRHRVGTGLGLALVAEHAAALGGQAWVEDRPGGGARFVVSFPAATP